LSASKNAFIRPSPSAGTLGGVARKTRESIILCEAAGFDTIFVETVGVGQSETAVHSMVDFFLLIQIAGAGDELQGIKRGIMEMADGIVINKCDGNNVDKAQIAKIQHQNALRLFPPTESGWSPEVLTCSALERKGINEVWNMIERYVQFTKANGYFEYKRNNQSKYWMYETIDEQLKVNFYQNEEIKYVNLKDCLFRIYRDIRFSPDKSPYKTNFGVYIAAGGGRKSPRGGYYLHLDPTGSFVSVGIWNPEPKVLKVLRKSVFENIDEFNEIRSNPEFSTYFSYFLEDGKLKKIPAGFPKDFPYAEFLKLRHYIVDYELDASFFEDNHVVPRLAGIMKAGYPLNQFLNFTVDELLLNNF
jgi:uncharacterized protein (TIGR02453 family)